MGRDRTERYHSFIDHAKLVNVLSVPPKVHERESGYTEARHQLPAPAQFLVTSSPALVVGVPKA